MKREYSNHCLIVDAWIQSSTPTLSTQDLINLFETAFDKLWEQSCYKISEVTLTAVMDRAIFNSSDIHKVLLKLTIGPEGIQWDDFRKTTADLKRHELIRAFSCLLTEFIAISSNITGGILTDVLHKTLDTSNLKKKKS